MKSGAGRWWSIGGALVGMSVLVLVLWRLDYGRLSQVVARSHAGFLLLVPLAVALEQLVRAWKWRQLLHDIRRIRTLRLFGAIMAGYLANILVPLGISPLVRSWLVARLEALEISTVLATAAIDRFIDGVVFVGFVVLALVFAVFPDPTGDIRLALTFGGAGNLVLFALLLYALARYKRRMARGESRIMTLVHRLPQRFAGRAGELAQGFADGVVWPRGVWRGVGIALASVVMKLIAITHFLWAGLAFGVTLHAADYVFLVVFLGFLIILTRLVRIPGGFLFGALFALDLLGVGEEEAFAMTLLVQTSSMLTIAAIGAVSLWRNGIAIADLRMPEEERLGSS
jgi:hypothetical protein